MPETKIIILMFEGDKTFEVELSQGWLTFTSEDDDRWISLSPEEVKQLKEFLHGD